MLRDLADQRDVFSLYLAVIFYVNSTCNVKTGKDVDDSCPKRVFHSVRYVRFCPSRPSLMSGYILASNHDISFFFRSVWGSCHGKLYCSRDIFKPQTIKFPRGKLPREKSVTLKIGLKNQVSLVWRFTWRCVAWQFSGQSQDGGLLQLVLWRHRRVRRIMTYLILNLIFLLEEEEITQRYVPLIWPWGSFSYDDGDGQQERLIKKKVIEINNKLCTFTCRHCTTTTWKGLIQGFMEGTFS